MKAAALLSLGAVALAAPTAEQATNVPVSRSRHTITRADGTADGQRWLSTLKYTLLKYNKNLELGSLLQNADIALKKRASNEPLTDFTEGQEDELYYGSGDVSGQTFKFDFDTGSSDTFVPGPKCGTAQGCDGTTKYDQSGTDEGNTTTVTYGSGQVSGENYFDDVTIAGLTANHQNVISLTQAQGFSGTGSDSLMGMAFQSIANSKSSPYFFTLVNQGKCSPSEFAFYLGRQKSGTAGQSQMTLCGRDSSRFSGAVTKVPVTSQTYWQTKIDGATVGGLLGGVSLPTTAGQAAIDTGTTLVIAPTVAALSIFAQIPGSVPIPLGLGVPPITGFAYPCASNPKVSLGFAGKQFAINPLDFNFGTITDDLGIALGNSSLSGLCIAGIAAADLDPTQNLYVVGDAFLKNWYSIYHFGGAKDTYVGFAKAAGNQ